jgi:hypothetical protein
MPYQVGPFDDTHIYVQCTGKLPGNEEFSWGFRMANTAGNGFVYSAGMHTAITTAVKAYHINSESNISPRVFLTGVKMNLINVDGHYSEPLTHEQNFPDLAGGGVATITLPNQITTAVSLTTGFSRGPAHRGRWYLPIPSNFVDDTGRIGTGAQGALVGTTTTFIAACNAASADWKMAVFSRKAGAAAHRLVTGCEVGRVLDTQRRRRRSLLESY